MVFTNGTLTPSFGGDKLELIYGERWFQPIHLQIDWLNFEQFTYRPPFLFSSNINF